jgi:hypothetical protein
VFTALTATNAPAHSDRRLGKLADHATPILLEYPTPRADGARDACGGVAKWTEILTIVGRATPKRRGLIAWPVAHECDCCEWSPATTQGHSVASRLWRSVQPWGVRAS